MKKLEMKYCNMILIKKQQKYHWAKLINMNILQVKKHYLLIEAKKYIKLSLPILHYLFTYSKNNNN